MDLGGLPMRDGFPFIPCTPLHKAFGARYAAAQRVLAHAGWWYRIALDGWSPPEWIRSVQRPNLASPYINSAEITRNWVHLFPAPTQPKVNT